MSVFEKQYSETRKQHTKAGLLQCRLPEDLLSWQCVGVGAHLAWLRLTTGFTSTLIYGLLSIDQRIAALHRDREIANRDR